MLYSQTKNKLSRLKEKTFPLEKSIQKLFEDNLELIFGLKPVKSECVIKNKKIDTLAYDSKARRFCIIEYKKDKSLSVFDQGITYLNLMLKNRGEITSEYTESCGAGLCRSDIRWDRSKIIFVAPEFTSFQLEAAEFWASMPQGRELAIELWKVKLFAGEILSVKPVKQCIPRANDESFFPSEAELLEGKPAHIVKLYNEVKRSALDVNSSISVRPRRLWTGFVLGGRIIADISVHKDYIKLWLNMKKGTLSDPLKLSRDVSGHLHWGSGDYELRLSDAKNLKYIVGLIKQAITVRQK